jgi:Fic family protein
MSTDIDAVLQRYPHLSFRRQWAETPELSCMLGKVEAIVDAISGLPILPEFRQSLHTLSLRKGAQATTAIEGNTLTDEDVQRVQAGEVLPVSKEYEQRELQNIMEAFNTLLKEILGSEKVEMITPELLQRFHEMIGRGLGARFHAVPGQFASSQRVVGPYRAPTPEHVRALVEQLCIWLRREFHYPNQTFSDAVIQSIVTHLYIEWIHPFDDGNGRTGRLVEFYILMRAGLPSMASHLLANHYNDTRAKYYHLIQHAGETQNLTPFLLYAVGGLVDGLMKTLEAIHENAMEQMWRVLVYGKFDALKPERRGAFRRRRSLALALPLERSISYDDIPNLTPELATAYAEANPRTVQRDIRELVAMDLAVRNAGLIKANRKLLDVTVAQRRKKR